MWTPRAAAKRGRSAGPANRLSFRPRLRGRARALLLLAVFSPLQWQCAWAQVLPPPRSAATPAGEELILSLSANGLARGDFSLLRQADGDFWVREADLQRLEVPAQSAARRAGGGDTYYSLRALGATDLAYEEATLSLALRFPAASLRGSVIDLAAPPPAAVISQPRHSLILSYRLSTAHTGGGEPARTTFESDLNVRVDGLLLRQASRLQAGGREGRGFTRGMSQLVYDRREDAQRFTAGDTVSTAGAYGSLITGGGLSMVKLYDMRPEVIRAPTASLRATTALPAEVEVAVDGTPIYRGNVGPGPIALDNLMMYGGTRNVRVTVTDISGRREVIEQPFLFTDSVLAAGLHDYAYFIGRRSELDADNRWRYRELAWQGFHRYGWNDSLTVGAGGEGNHDFSNAGGGITLRSDMLGLFSLDLLASRDRSRGTTATGWSGRYTYVAPAGALLLGHRAFEDGFRTFTTSPSAPFLRSESHVGLSTRAWQATLSADWVRSRDRLEHRDTAILRAAGNLTRDTTLSAEVQKTRVNGRHEWAAYLFLRMELGGQHWVGMSARADGNGHGIDAEAGKQLLQGEEVGWRVGASADHGPGGNSRFSYGALNWNMRPATLELYGSSIGTGQYAEAAVSGAVVAIDGYWGLTRQVTDSFALARLGVPASGVEVLLNNQVQGVTDERGLLFIPNVGAYGRQDVSINDKQLGMQYNLSERRKIIAPPYRSGSLVDFGGKKLNAIAGMAWLLEGQGRRAVAARAFSLAGRGGTLAIETGSSGDFYLEDVAAGDYQGRLQAGDRHYVCRLRVPEFSEPVLELKEGILCE